MMIISLSSKDNLYTGLVCYFIKCVKSCKWVGVNGVSLKWTGVTIVAMVQWHGKAEDLVLNHFNGWSGISISFIAAEWNFWTSYLEQILGISLVD